MKRKWSFQNPFIAVLVVVFLSISSSGARAERFVPPTSPRETFNFNLDWRFIKEDIAGAEVVAFDDAKWESVSTPHTFNDIDSFRTIISHGGGDRGTYMGVAWYRKHFKLPEDLAGRKVFLEFEGMRQAGDVFINGKEVGLYENGVTAYGIDITDAVSFGKKENVIAVKVDNRADYKEKSSGVGFQWSSRDFNPNYGGINRRVWLHVTGKIYQTLPLYCGLQTTGVYVYPGNISVPENSADVNVEAQVKNESGDQASITLSTAVVDADGQVRATFDGETIDMVAGEKTVLKASGKLSGAKLWSIENPYLYDVYTILKVNDKVVDVNRVRTGFRKTAFRGGAGTGGVYINDKFVYLTGYAQRVSNEWAGLGQAYPDWMHDLSAQMLRASNGNYMRWMHISPQKVDVEAYDRAGIIEVCPAGDKEKDATGRQWEQRMEVMRVSMIYMRNHPSILFWEAGNNSITADHLKQMTDLQAELDPNGGRVMGCRTLNDPDTTPIAGYFGVMIGQDPRTDALKSTTQMFRAYSAERRDRAPVIETEDFRDEAARRFWDDYSPPHFGFKPGPNDTYKWNSETFCLAAANRYWVYWSNRISNTDPAHAKWSGYASIYYFDSNADGRQDSSEVCRVSGKVDAVRLPKEAFYTYRVMQSRKQDIHIIGHWTYPAGTKKTIYVICNNCDAVELSLSGKVIGNSDQPKDGCVFAFPNVEWSAGALKAVGFTDGNPVCEHELKTAGEAKRIKLTPILGPGGLHADRADVALVDVEVVDAMGQRCPTDEGRINFELQGPAIWRGGYNSGVINSTNNTYLSTECGINRVAIRSTSEAGTIKLTAIRKGLEPATAEIVSKPVKIIDGLLAETLLIPSP
jgi:beta-galactosidase